MIAIDGLATKNTELVRMSCAYKYSTFKCDANRERKSDSNQTARNVIDSNYFYFIFSSIYFVCLLLLFVVSGV